MDAPTTTTAGSGSSDGDSGDWGWFTPTRPSPEDPGGQADDGDQAPDGSHEPGASSAPEQHTDPQVADADRPHAPREAGGWFVRGGAPAPPADPQQTSSARAPRPETAHPGEPHPEAARSRTFHPEAPVPGAAESGSLRPAPAGGLTPSPASAPEAFRAPAFGGPGPHLPAEAAPGRGAVGHSPVAVRGPLAPGAAEEPGAREPAGRAAGMSGPAAPAGTRAAAAAETAGDGSADARLIRRNLDEVEPIADKLTSYFYALLFVRNPDVRSLFPAAMDTQRDRLFGALLTAAGRIDDPARLTEYLSHLGRGHRRYGTRPEHYPAVGECLLASLARYATRTWGPECEAAWVRVYTEISQIMIDAAAEDEDVAPAWWDAEIVSHELRTSEIAVVTVRPDQPYPFRAGQYTSVETPWWPRVWRHYSFAGAPRSDGLLSFHVKAVPAGWVSNALVHRARPGDVIRLGAPAGSMTVDHHSGSGLLCLGGGTGIAPIKALVEDVVEHGRRRPVDVFYGARSDHDLYDIDTLLRMAHAHPWLHVRPVVAHGYGGGSLDSFVGQLPDAVRRYGPWEGYDGYLSGPPGLIRSGLEALVGVGIPNGRIRHDSLEELVAAGTPPLGLT